LLPVHAFDAHPSYAKKVVIITSWVSQRAPATFIPQRLLLILLIRGLHIFNVLLLECVERDLVQTKQRLVGVLDEHVLALVHAKDHIDDSTNNTPTVVEVERHLGSEVAGLIGKHTEDNVVVVVLGVGTGDETTITLELI
jgi:hypothetical protein